MNADAKLDAALRRKPGVALDHAGLHLDGAAHGVHDAPEFDDRAVAGALDNAPVMGGVGGVDEIAAEAPKTRKGPVLVSAGEPAIADDICDQDRCEFARLAHRAPHGVATLAQMPAPVCLFDGRTAHVDVPSVPGTNRE